MAVSVKWWKSQRVIILLHLLHARSPTNENPAVPSRLRRADVDVRVEEVLGIVFGFELPQPAVIGPVSGGRWIPRFVAIEIVHIAHLGEKRFQSLERPATPCET